MELRETIDLEVERLGLPGLRTELAALERELFDSGRREEALRKAVSLWDRWMIFHDTPEEQQLKGGRRRRQQLEKSLAYVRAQVTAANARLGELCPPFAVAIGLSECLPLAYTGIAVEGWLLRRVGRDDELRAALADLAGLLRRTYFPTLDFAALRARLADASACQALSSLAEQPLPLSPRLGHAPLTGDAPLGKVAERLLDNGFFAARYREDELGQRCAALATTARHADAGVGWWDRINVLTKSPDEHARDVADAEQLAAQEELRRVIEGQQRLLHAAMRAYPPLDFYHGVVEALGIAALLKADKELVVTERRLVEARPVVAPRALLLAAVRRLQDVFAASFPGVPSPRELAHRSTADPLHGDPAAAAFMRHASVSPRLLALRDEALVHAGMVGQIREEMADVGDRISLLDRLVFWSHTDAERAEKDLERRGEANKAWTWRLWQEMLAEARRIGAGIGPLATRDRAIGAHAAIGEIHTDSGSSSFPKYCQVYKQDEAIAALRQLRGVFERIYGVTGTVSQLMAASVVATPEAFAAELDDDHGWAPLPLERLLGLLAAHLADTGFKQQYAAVQTRMQQLQSAGSEQVEVAEDISLWDRLNVFRTTAAEARSSELKRQISGLREELGQRRERLHDIFWAKLRAYPPALLACDLDNVVQAVEDIRAVCRSYTVTTGSGNNRRTQTRYRCELIGKEAAEHAMQRWLTRMLEVFGEQLGYHELLEALELGPVEVAQS